MLDITRKAFININAHDRSQHHPDLKIELYPDITGEKEIEFMEATITYKVPSFMIKLRPMKYGDITKYHMINNEEGQILPYGSFMSVLKTLRMSTPAEEQTLNWNIYTGQPIWEFSTDPEVLKNLIIGYSNRIIVEVR